MTEPGQRDDVARISKDTLAALTDVASTARARLAENRASGAHSFAIINTFTSGEALKSLGVLDVTEN
ncbi:hypothetical protein [Rhodovulum steppense]|uniref:Uncharacterized protein n=1 Tax=Rhodovulum steppense TaxID=540251 RepID=A0A4R1YLJ0_9RHOB|nr:hypothetical protein [Rhodovulum steppense]TCM78060.1 hypothetical protein EV216_1271 [Rhodovulum steppense]